MLSDKRLRDPTREFGDVESITSDVDPTTRRTGSRDDIDGGISGQGNPQTATGRGSFAENHRDAIRGQSVDNRGGLPELDAIRRRTPDVDPRSEGGTAPAPRTAGPRPIFARGEALGLLEQAEAPQATSATTQLPGVEDTSGGSSTAAGSSVASDAELGQELTPGLDTRTPAAEGVDVGPVEANRPDTDAGNDTDFRSDMGQEPGERVDTRAEDALTARSDTRGETRTATETRTETRTETAFDPAFGSETRIELRSERNARRRGRLPDPDERETIEDDDPVFATTTETDLFSTGFRDVSLDDF